MNIQIKDEPGLRYDAGKPRVDLIPADAVLEIGNVFGWGATKYLEHNWCKGMSWSRVLASAERHLLAIKSGEDFDKESELTHAGHLAWNAIVLISYFKRGVGTDDRFKENAHVPDRVNSPHASGFLPEVGPGTVRDVLRKHAEEIVRENEAKPVEDLGYAEGEEHNFAQKDRSKIINFINAEIPGVEKAQKANVHLLQTFGRGIADRARRNGLYLDAISEDRTGISRNWHYVDCSDGARIDSQSVCRPSFATVRNAFLGLLSDADRACFFASDGNLSEEGCKKVEAFISARAARAP